MHLHIVVKGLVFRPRILLSCTTYHLWNLSTLFPLTVCQLVLLQKKKILDAPALQFLVMI